MTHPASDSSDQHLVWTSVGTGLYCPVVVSPGAGRVILLVRDATGALLCQEKNGEGWGAARSLGVPLAQSPGSEVFVPVDWQLGACADGTGEIDIVARSPDGDLLYLRSTLAEPSTFECLGAPAAMPATRAVPIGLACAPVVCRSEPDRLEVFALGPDGDLVQAVCSGAEWGAFDSLGLPAPDTTAGGRLPPGSEGVAVCRCGASRVAVFRRGARGDLLLKWWNGERWSNYASLGSPEIPDPSYPAVTISAPLTGPPAACSWGPTRLDVFARGPDGDLVHTSWDGGDWSQFVSVGMPIADGQPVPLAGAVSVCTAREHECDVVAGAVDGRLYHLVWNDAERGER